MGCTQSTSANQNQAPVDTKPAAAVEEQAPSLTSVKAGPAPEAPKGISNKVALGAGCFWGVQKYIEKDFQKKFPHSIKRAEVGFMSPLDRPRIKKPSYKQVCTGTSGHVEVLYVELNNPELHFEEMLRFFFSFHDPTLKDRQGNDRGFQYSSWIFCGDEEQRRIAEKVRRELQAAIDQKKIVWTFETRKVETQLCDLKPFTRAEKYHQNYLAQNPNGYCNHRIRMKQWYELK